MQTLTLHRLLEQACQRHDQQPALVLGERALTYRELNQQAAALAAGLIAKGVRRGDRVALLLRNCLEYIIADYAIMKLGAVKVPLNDMLSADDVGYIFEHADVNCVVVHSSLSSLLPSASGALLVEVVDLPASKIAGERFEDLLATQTLCPELEDAPDAVAAILYTGGTTGRPKGVVHTGAGFGADALAGVLAGEFSNDERALFITPLPHAAGICLYSNWIQGGISYVETSFDADLTLDLIAQHQITWIWAVPTMIYRLLDSPRLGHTDLNSLRTILYGAAPITELRLREGLAAFGSVFLQIYGQTECPMWVTCLSKRDHKDPKLLGSCGKAAVGAEVRIGGETGAWLPPGEAGEVCVRAPFVLKEYHHAPEQTAASFHGGWLRTGDVGYKTESGHLFLVDRAKDMIISGGMNVYSSEVENVAQEYPGVAQVAVIGIPDDDWGEAVHAVLVCDEEFDRAAFIDFCKQRLAKYKVPKSFSEVASIPVTAYGKMDKKLLRAEYWHDAERAIN